MKNAYMEEKEGLNYQTLVEETSRCLLCLDAPLTFVAINNFF